MKKLKIAAFSVVLAIVTGLFTGCASQVGTAEQKETVSVGLWGNHMLENYASWLQEQYPDINFEFYVINNSTEYYKFRSEHGDLPDILTVRRFSLRDVEPLKDELLDLSDTQLANSFYQSYLRNYTYDDGTVNWLPACAEVDDIVVNKTLFEENSIPLPTDWDSFVYACEEFEKLGIQGYVTDFSMDYTCMETLQGFSIGQMTTTEGRTWRQQYESGLTDELSESVWLPAFERLVEFLDVTGVTEDNFSLSSTDIMNDFAEGKIAMYRGTGADLTSYGDFEKVMMAYPGNTEGESWYLTYPAFQVAANAGSIDSDERRELILDIMATMFTEDAFAKIASGQNMIAYNRDVSLEMISEFDNLKSYIEDNRIYIRLASSEMFSVSQSVVQKLITGELTTAQEAFDAFNEEMKADTVSSADKTYTVTTALSGKFKDDGGCEAASAVYNTLREGLGVDCVLGPATIVTGNMPSGSYAEGELKYIINGTGGFVLKMDLTGDEILNLVQHMLTVKQTRDSIAGDTTLPVSSGFEMEMTKNSDGYKVTAITINGEKPEAGKTYSLIFRINYEPDIEKLEAAGFAEYESLSNSVIMNTLKAKLESSSDLCAATDYITLNRA